MKFAIVFAVSLMSAVAFADGGESSSPLMDNYNSAYGAQRVANCTGVVVTGWDNLNQSPIYDLTNAVCQPSTITTAAEAQAFWASQAGSSNN